MTEELVQMIPQLGFGGIVFVIWFFDQKKIDSYKILVERTIEREEAISAMNAHMLQVIEKNTEAFARFSERLKAMSEK